VASDVGDMYSEFVGEARSLLLHPHAFTTQVLLCVSIRLIFFFVCFSMFQRVSLCYSVLRCVSMCCSVLHFWNVARLQLLHSHACNTLVLQCIAVYCSACCSACCSARCSVLQCVAVCCTVS